MECLSHKVASWLDFTPSMFDFSPLQNNTLATADAAELVANFKRLWAKSNVRSCIGEREREERERR